MKTHALTKELLGLPGIPESKAKKEEDRVREVNRKLTEMKCRYTTLPGKGSPKAWEIKSLPLEARKYLAPKNTTVGFDLVITPAVQAVLADVEQQKLAADEKERQRLEARLESSAKFDALPAWQQKAPKAKFAIIVASNTYITRHCLAKTEGQDEFAHQYSLGEIKVAAWVREQYRNFHPNTLRSWIREEHELGMMGLVDHYANRKDQGKIETWNNGQMAQTIEALLLKYPDIKEKKCNEALRGLLPDAPYVSSKTVGRFMDKWKERHLHRFSLANNPDDYKNRLQPAPGSRSEGITGIPNKLWEIDATPADLLLTDGQRYKIIGVTDVGTARLKYYVTKTEKARDNAWVVRNCILDWGIPRYGTLVTDQGRPYIGDHFTRILSDLEIDQHICQPFSGDQKPHIERSFRTFSHDLIELIPGYCGHSVEDRKRIEGRKTFAQRLMTRDEVIEVAVSAEELQAFIDRWIANYHNTPHSRLGKTPNQTLADWPHAIYTIPDVRALDVLLAEAARRGGKLPIIGKKGIRVNGGFYIHPALGNYTGLYCRAFQDPADLGRIIVNVQNEHAIWEFLCIAEDPKRTGISMMEVAEATKELHKEHKKEMARLNRESKKLLKGVDILDAVMTYREKTAAEAQGNVAHFPRRTIEHTTPGLVAAGLAAQALDGVVATPAPPALTAQEQAIKEQFKAEELSKQNSNVRSLEAESSKMKYKRMKALRQVLTDGGIISEEDYRQLMMYEQTPEYRALKGMEEEFGAVAFK